MWAQIFLNSQKRSKTEGKNGIGSRSHLKCLDESDLWDGREPNMHMQEHTIFTSLNSLQRHMNICLHMY